MQHILKNKKLIITLFQIVEAGLVLVWFIGAVLLLQNQNQLGTIYGYGLEFGKYALVLYCLTLVPGILQRFDVLTQLRVILMTFRRHLGILTFILAWLHMSWGTTLPLVSVYGLTLKGISVLNLTQWVGISAMTLLLPLFLTSNDYSVKKLGSYWKKIHKLTYIVLFLLFFHVALVQSEWLIVIVPTMLAWIFSWITYFSRNFAKKSRVEQASNLNIDTTSKDDSTLT